MSRSEQERFADIRQAIQRCLDYKPHLQSDEFASMAYDAVLRNLAVIGEAVRSLRARHEIKCPMFRGLQSQACETSSFTNTSA